MAALTATEKWWHILTDVDDPITLEPISTLRYEPFAIPTSSSHKSFFDPVALAQYSIATSKFENPLTRIPFDRALCRSLDAHIARSLPAPRRPASVEEGFVFFHSNDARSDDLRAVAAIALQNLFAFRHDNGNDDNDTDDNGNAIIDDDERVVSNSSSLSHSDFPNALNITAPRPPPSAASTQQMIDRALEKLAIEEESHRAAALLAQQAAAQQRSARKEAREILRKTHAERIQRLMEEAEQEAQLAAKARREIAQFQQQQFERAEVQTNLDSSVSQLLAEEKRKNEASMMAGELKRSQQIEEKEKEAAAATASEAALLQQNKLKEKQRLKRQKAKQRAKQKKIEDAQIKAATQKQLEIEEKLKSTTLKCARCDKGILSEKDAFEKNDRKFCSSSCAREGPRT